MAMNCFAQGAIDVHSHIITPEFVSSLENEGRLMDEGFPLPKYNVESHLKWMDEAGVETSVLTLAAPQPTSADIVRQTNEAAARIKKEYPGRFRLTTRQTSEPSTTTLQVHTRQRSSG